MAFFELNDVFGYQDANDTKKLWADTDAPPEPGNGEIWLDTAATPYQLKRFNGTGWDIIGDKPAADLLTSIKTVDGSGSGLDADKLDGQEGSYYRNAANLNSGTIPLDRLPTTLTGKDADKLDGQEGSYYQNAGNLNAGTLPLDRIPATLTGKSTDKIDNLEASQFIRSDTSDNVTGHTEWQDNYHVRFGNDADFRMWHDGSNTYMRSYKHGANFYLQAENAFGTNNSYITVDPNDESVETFGRFINRKINDTSIGSGVVITTDIPEGTVGLFMLKNVSTGTAAVFFLGWGAADGVKIASGNNSATDGTAFYSQPMAYRMCVYFDSGWLKIKNQTGATRTIRAGFFGLD
jgi:hypothetical protein